MMQENKTESKAGSHTSDDHNASIQIRLNMQLGERSTQEPLP